MSKRILLIALCVVASLFLFCGSKCSSRTVAAAANSVRHTITNVSSQDAETKAICGTWKYVGVTDADGTTTEIEEDSTDGVTFSSNGTVSIDFGDEVGTASGTWEFSKEGTDEDVGDYYTYNLDMNSDSATVSAVLFLDDQPEVLVLNIANNEGTSLYFYCEKVSS